MGLFDVFKRQPSIETATDFEDFLDSRAAYTAQKCVFEFSRASAGYVWQALFKEQTFLEQPFIFDDKKNVGLARRESRETGAETVDVVV